MLSISWSLPTHLLHSILLYNETFNIGGVGGGGGNIREWGVLILAGAGYVFPSLGVNSRGFSGKVVNTPVSLGSGSMLQARRT